MYVALLHYIFTSLHIVGFYRALEFVARRVFVGHFRYHIGLRWGAGCYALVWTKQGGVIMDRIEQRQIGTNAAKVSLFRFLQK